MLPDVNPSIRALVAGEPAEKAGLKAGDVIVSIDGERMVFASQVSEAIAEAPGAAHSGRWCGATGASRRSRSCPRGRATTAASASTSATTVESFTPSPLEAIGMSVQRNVEMAGLILRTLGDLFTGEASPRQLMGPVGIAQLSGESAQAGWIALFSLMASISLNLGLLNLLPIPVLDGGHIFIMGIETIVAPRLQPGGQGEDALRRLRALMALMVTVIYNDLTRIAWIENLMPWR